MSGLCALLIAFCLFAITATNAAEIPLANFARHAQFRDVRISPDGQYMAANSVVGDQAVLSLIRLSDHKGVNLSPRDRDEVIAFQWVGRRVVYTVGEKTGGLERPQPTGEIYVVNADGGDSQLLFGYRVADPGYATHIKSKRPERARARVIGSDGQDDDHLLIAVDPWNGSADGSYPEARVLNLRDGATRTLTTAPLRRATFVADHQGAIRFAWGEDKDQMQKVYYRPGAKSDWQLLFDEAREHTRVEPLRFDRKGDAVYFDCGGARGLGGLCRWDVATRKLTTLWSSEESEATGFVSSSDDKDIVAVRSMPGRPSVTVLDKSAPETRLLVEMMRQFPGEDVHFTSFSKDGTRAVILVVGDTDPGRYYLYDAQTRQLTFLMARAPWLDSAKLAPVEPITLKARDGLHLHGYLTRPPGKGDAKNLPLVVFVHGGPYFVRDDWYYDPYVQMLASRGYAVLQVNYRGSGGYGHAFVKAGFGQWGGAMQDDVTDATRWAIAQGIADSQRICIFGGSYGGYAALEGAVKEPDLYRCAIGYVGVYDLRLMYTRGDVSQSVFGENYLKMVLGTDQADLWNRSPIAHLDQLKAKVMLVVGGADKRVPPVQGENLHTALERRHIAHEWLYQRTEGHGFYNEANLADLFTRVIAFLDANIGQPVR